MITPEQARFFARNGFVQLSDCIPAAACAHLIECTWQHLPAHWRRDDPTSWRGPVADSCHVASLDFRGGLMKFASGCSGGAIQARKVLLADPVVTASYQDPSSGHRAALDLIGRPLHPIRLRGLYAIAPPEDASTALAVPSPHVEAHPAQIVALTYLDDVAPGGGGLLVWPGSHRDLHAAFLSKFDYVAGPSLAAVVAEHLRCRPVELPGGRGDVILMHHRLLHSPSINHRDRIRFGFLCDYTPRDHHELCRQPPGELWADWPGLVQLAGADGLAGVPDFVCQPALVERRRVARSEVGERTRNKSEASRIGRSRRPGEVWVSLSDSPELYDSNERLDPRGGPLAATQRWPWAKGVRVVVNGAPVTSVSEGGFTARLTVRRGRNVISVRGIERPLWLRVLAIAAPFSASRVIVRQALDGRRRTVDLPFEVDGVAVQA